nr:MAG TPA: hypothetical protein [Caudoviricetes sp.]
MVDESVEEFDTFDGDDGSEGEFDCPVGTLESVGILSTEQVFCEHIGVGCGLRLFLLGLLSSAILDECRDLVQIDTDNLGESLSGVGLLSLLIRHLAQQFVDEVLELFFCIRESVFVSHVSVLSSDMKYVGWVSITHRIEYTQVCVRSAVSLLLPMQFHCMKTAHKPERAVTGCCTSSR